MKYIRRWDLPAPPYEHIEHFDAKEGFGHHVFWFCKSCRSIYASCILSPEDCSPRVWCANSGLCLTCDPDLYFPRGTLDSSFTIGWEFDLPILQYQLDREIDFLGHQAHPHNRRD